MHQGVLCGMLRDVSSKGCMPKKRGCRGPPRTSHSCGGGLPDRVRRSSGRWLCWGGSEPSQEKQGHTEATKEQGSPEATASEEARCKKTRPIDLLGSVGAIPDMSVKPGDPEALYVTNDLPGCQNGGLLSGTDKPDQLA